MAEYRRKLPSPPVIPPKIPLDSLDGVDSVNGHLKGDQAAIGARARQSQTPIHYVRAPPYRDPSYHRIVSSDQSRPHPLPLLPKAAPLPGYARLTSSPQFEPMDQEMAYWRTHSPSNVDSYRLRSNAIQLPESWTPNGSPRRSPVRQPRSPQNLGRHLPAHYPQSCSTGRVQPGKSPPSPPRHFIIPPAGSRLPFRLPQQEVAQGQHADARHPPALNHIDTALQRNARNDAMLAPDPHIYATDVTLPYPIDDVTEFPMDYENRDDSDRLLRPSSNQQHHFESSGTDLTPTPYDGSPSSLSKHALPDTPRSSVDDYQNEDRRSRTDSIKSWDHDSGHRDPFDYDCIELLPSPHLESLHAERAATRTHHPSSPVENFLSRPPSLRRERTPSPAFTQSGLKVARKPTSMLLPDSPPPRSPSLAEVADSEIERWSVSTKAFDISPKLHKPNVTRLSSKMFALCEEPWSLSSLSSWICDIFMSESECVSEHSVTHALIGLMRYHTPTISSVIAEGLAKIIMLEFHAAAFLCPEGEEMVSMHSVDIQGVMVQLTGHGCYSIRCHGDDQDLALGRCYSSRCHRTPPKLMSMDFETGKMESDWQTFWCVGSDVLEGMEKREILRQNMLHEIVVNEVEYVRDLEVANSHMRRGLMEQDERAFSPYRKEKFLACVFGHLDPICRINSQFLLPELRTRQRTEGPVIKRIGDIFLEWVRSARAAHLSYSDSFPLASKLMRDAKKNSSFAAWEAKFESDSRSQRLGVLHFINRPNQRVGRYALLLKGVLKNMDPSHFDYAVMQTAIGEIEELGAECNSRIGAAEKRVKVIELSERLSWRTTADKVDLQLTAKQRRFIKDGSLLRQSDSRIEWVESHVVLLDHYLLITKERKDPLAPGGAWFYASKKPIPLHHLVIDSLAKEPERKSRKVFGMAFTSAVDVSTQSPLSGSSAPTSAGSKDSNAINLPPAVTGIDDGLEGVMYPIRFHHLGKDGQTYTLFASSAEIRSKWGECLVRTQESYHQYLHNANPFTLRILADVSFGYSLADRPALPLQVKGTTVELALRETAQFFPLPELLSKVTISTSRIRCVARFKTVEGRYKLCIGTENGLFCSDSGDIRNWYSASLSVKKVKQMHVMEEYGVILLLADKNLIYYGLDSLTHSSNQSTRKTGYRLTMSGGVGYFAVNKIAGRTLVFCKSKRRDGVSSIFDVFEPIRTKTYGSGVSHNQKVEAAKSIYFRDYASFSLNADTYGINLFDRSFAVLGAKGFEVSTLSRMSLQSIPTTKKAGFEKIYARLGKVRTPLGMLRISDKEFLLCYEGMKGYRGVQLTTTECGFYVDTHGEFSRSQTLEFLGKPKAVATHLPFLFAFEPSFVEILCTQTGKSHQVIPGVDVRCVDKTDGRVKFAVAHPEIAGKQLVAELVMQRGVTV